MDVDSVATNKERLMDVDFHHSVVWAMDPFRSEM